MKQAQIMRLEGRFDMRGLMGMIKFFSDTPHQLAQENTLFSHIRCKSDFWLCSIVETVERKYRDILWYAADSHGLRESIAGANREALWQVSLS